MDELVQCDCKELSLSQIEQDLPSLARLELEGDLDFAVTEPGSNELDGFYPVQWYFAIEIQPQELDQPANKQVGFDDQELPRKRDFYAAVGTCQTRPDSWSRCTPDNPGTTGRLAATAD